MQPRLWSGKFLELMAKKLKQKIREEKTKRKKERWGGRNH